MGSIPDPGREFVGGDFSQPTFDEFQRQTSLMTSCTLLWKELSDHFLSLEQDLLKKSEAVKNKIENLNQQTKESLDELENREVTIDETVKISLERIEQSKNALIEIEKSCGGGGEVDDSEGLLMTLKKFCWKMDSEGFWKFVAVRKKELDSIRAQISEALGECVDPARFALEAISEVFPVDKRVERSERSNDLGWACVLILESLIPVVVDPVIGKSRLLVTPSVKKRAKEIAETWKESLDQRGGIENVKTPDVHTFLQHLVTFGIVKKEDVNLYRKLVVGSAWRKHMPKLAVSLGLGDKMADMIEELISKKQLLDAVHFAFEVGLMDKFPPVPLLKAYLKDAKDPHNSGRASHLTGRREQSALRAVIKCIEDYKLEAEFPPESLKKRLEQLEKVKTEKKRSAAAAPANKRTRASNVGPMPPAKAGRLTNAYVSSFPSPTFVHSPSHGNYPTPPSYPYDRSPTSSSMYGSRSPQTNPYAYSPDHYGYSPEAVSPVYTTTYHLPSPPPPMGYPAAAAYGGYGNGMQMQSPYHHQAYY